MYRVRIYATDPGSKSGRRKINKNSQGGKTAKEAAEVVAKALTSLSDADSQKIVRVLIESETAGAESGDLKLTFEAPKSGNGGAAKKQTVKSGK